MLSGRSLSWKRSWDADSSRVIVQIRAGAMTGIGEMLPLGIDTRTGRLGPILPVRHGRANLEFNAEGIG